MRTDAGNYYYLPDGLGSIAAVTDSAGNLAASYSYEPFGTLKSSTGTLSNPYRWLGGLGVYHDTTTGLYKMGTRYYDPAIGRFTQVDPIRGGSANAYDYAEQNPINYSDADGQFCWKCKAKKAALALKNGAKKAKQAAKAAKATAKKAYGAAKKSKIATKVIAAGPYACLVYQSTDKDEGKWVPTWNDIKDSAHDVNQCFNPYSWWQ